MSYVITEAVQGDSLRALLRRGHLTPGKTIEIGRQIADALAAAHEASVLHLDLRAENVLVSREGHVKVMDFAVAKPAITMKAGIPLAVENQAPEQVRGEPGEARS